MEAIFQPEGLFALLALTVMETVLGIDNVIFIAVLVAGLPKKDQANARRFGLILALGLRLLMLLGVTTLLALNQPVISPMGFDMSWRDIIMIAGGAFLVAKATHEILVAAEGGEHLSEVPSQTTRLVPAVIQIAVINLVFSIDSTVTAVGMSRNVWIMAIAIIIAMVIMYAAAGWVSNLVNRHPAAKVLALAFLLLVGVVLISDGLHHPFDHRVLYGAMLFACVIAAVAMSGARYRRRLFKTRRKQLRALQRASSEASASGERTRS